MARGSLDACLHVHPCGVARAAHTDDFVTAGPAKLSDKLLEELGTDVILKIGPALDADSPDFAHFLSRQRGRDGDSMLKKVDAHFVEEAATIIATLLDVRPARTPALTDNNFRHPPADEGTALNPDLRLAFRSAVVVFPWKSTLKQRTSCKDSHGR